MFGRPLIAGTRIGVDFILKAKAAEFSN
ncbi:MAG: DUF433 domain-containing protein [Rubrivivax sp.]